MSDPRTLVVSMPWASSSFPALGVGALVAAARRRGFHCDAWYANLGFASTIGAEVYEWIAAESEAFALAEHLFAVDLFGSTALDSDAFLTGVCAPDSRLSHAGSTLTVDALETLRDIIVPAFLDECTEYLLDRDVDVVGFSCVFNQALPSLALAQRFKRQRPGAIVVLGGGLMHGAMGPAYARAFRDVVDHVFTGESDLTFPELLEALRSGGEVRTIPGVTIDGALSAPAPLVVTMDALPTPNYDGYFAERDRLERAGRRLTPHHNLPFESARGCWWGEKHHCVFCGLNTEGMPFRSKSPDRVIDELTELSSRYRTVTFAAADNILTHDAYRTLLPRLADAELDLRLFYEIKANVGRDDVAALHRAGVQWLVPGIESFSDHVLELIRKGATATQNIQLLKWLQEFGITPFYNVLVGFPGETDEDFTDMLRVIPLLQHLPAPTFGHGRANLAQVHRFSPFFNEPDRLGLQNVRSADYYRHLIPPAVLAGEEYGYFFERDIPDDAPLRRYWRRLNETLDQWRSARGHRWAELGAGYLRVWRTHPTEETEVVLDTPSAVIVVLADEQTSRSALKRDFIEAGGGGGIDVDAMLDDLIDRHVIVEIGPRLVSVVPFRRPHTRKDLLGWLRRWSTSTSPALAPGPGAVPHQVSA